METLASQATSASATMPPSQSTATTTTTHETNNDDTSSDPNLGPRIGMWTGIVAVILILMSISGWFFYRRGKKKRVKLEQQNATDQEQGHMNSTNNSRNVPAGGFLTGGKPELCGESADPARVRTELPGDLERPLLSSINQGNGDAHRTGDGTDHSKSAQGQSSEMPATVAGGAAVMAELDGNSSTAMNLVELPGSLPPLRKTRTETGQMVIRSGEAARIGAMLETSTTNPLSQPSCGEPNS